MVSIISSVLIIAVFCFWVDREEGRDFFKKHGYTRKSWKRYRKMMNDSEYRNSQKGKKLNIL